ncbi:MAG: DUF4238 domain-containing protein [Cellvibrionaceae bacterium]
MPSKKLVINQHTFPAKSIQRFTDSKGCVELYRIPSRNVFPAAPNNKIFCRRRVWDQRSEQGYGKHIEDRFQALVDYVVTQNLIHLPPEAHRIIGEFYTLWKLRCTIEEYDHLVGKLNRASRQKLTEEEKQTLELKHALYTEEDGSLPKRFSRGLGMQIGIEQFMARNGDLRWYISRSDTLEFLIADNPGEEFIVPVTPNLCFILEFNIPKLTPSQVIQLNLGAISRSKQYYFSKALAKCIFA